MKKNFVEGNDSVGPKSRELFAEFAEVESTGCDQQAMMEKAVVGV
ncbi:MAG: hypothetical protein ACOYBE_07405 [Blautia sp.]|jgi:hypothetical protein